MHKRLFYFELSGEEKPIHLSVSAYTIDHALQVMNAFILGTGRSQSVWEIRADPKRGCTYEEIR